MFRLIRQNPAVRTLPKWMVMSAVTAGLLMNAVSFYFLKQHESTDPLLVVSVVWLAATLYLVFGEVRTRCSPFDIALPIPTRKVWLSHLSAVILSGVAIIGATAAIIAGGIWLLWKLSGRWMVPVEGLGGMAFQLIAGLILAVVLLQNPLPSQNQLPRTRERIVLAVIVMAAVLALAVTLNAVSPWTALIPLTLAAAVGAYRLRSLPKAFSLAAWDSAVAVMPGREEVSDQWRAVYTGKSPGGPALARLLDWTVWRCFTVGVKVKHSPWITYPFVLVFGAFLSGLDGRWIDNSLRFNIIWITVYVLIAFSMHPPKQIYLLDGLTISRHRILNVMVLPLVFTLAAGYGAGRVTLAYLDRSRPMPLEVIHFIQDREDGNYYLYVPVSAARIAWDGRVPDVQAPWGETHKMWSRPVIAGAPCRLYSSYSTPRGSSIDYVAWQMARAVEAVYGQSIPPEELKRRYLRERTDGGAALVQKKLTLSADYPYLRRIRNSGPAFPVVIGLSYVLWMLALAVYFQAFRAGVSGGKKMATAVGLLALMMFGWVAVIFGPLVRFLRTYDFNGGLTAAVCQAGDSRVATAAVWILMIAVAAASHRLALWRFKKVEGVPERKVSMS
jgi:hypothetical protein